jgi:hypothetical protein
MIEDMKLAGLAAKTQELYLQGNRVKKFVTKGKNAESVLILESVGGDSDGRRHGLVRGGL